MLNVSEQLKNILKNDRFPMTDTVASKDLEIIFDGMSPIYADQVVDDSFSLTESIIAEDDIRFGTCRASQIKFKLANVQEELKSKEFTINQLIDNEYVIPLGKYKVESAKLQDDLIFKEVIAYDKLKDADVDVSDWYNGLFPAGNETYTLKQFRSSLLAHLGIEEVPQTLPNDDMVVEKTIDPTQISGRTVLEATVELNGAFGNINRYGKFRRIVLQPAYGLYPAETLYPSEHLYPVSETDTSYVSDAIIDENINKAMYKSVRFEEYTVKEIDKLQIRAEENDIGAIVGTGTNTYVIEGNFLVFGKSASELEQIALNVYGNTEKRPYRPFTAENIGLPYIEVGDSLEYATDDVVHGYVLQRTLTGIQSLWDEIEAPGSEEREQNFSVNKEIIQLQGRTAVLKRTVEEVSNTLTNLAEDTESRFTQTAEQIELKVSKSGIVSAINQTAEEIKIQANKISLEGIVTANGNVKILPDGTLEAINGKFSGNLTGSTYIGGYISGTQITSSGNGVLEIDGAEITGFNSSGGLVLFISANGTVNAGAVTATDGYFTRINGYTPVHDGNIGSKSVNYATTSGYATSSLDSAYSYGLMSTGSSPVGATVYVSINGNLRPYTSGLSSCGTSEGKWSAVYANNGTIITSDERMKIEIKPLADDVRFLKFAKMIVPYTYKMINGTSGRKHTGFIAQRIEEAMAECGISSMEFAGIVKAPVYAEKLKDEDGNELNEYDTTSEIVGYDYNLRYDEFIPLLFLWMRSKEVEF